MPLSRLVKNAESSGSKIDLALLTGAHGCGKSHLLKDLADSTGYAFREINCLSHFNITKLRKALQTTKTYSIIEFGNFDKYNLLLE